jgi:hypothetical protein
VTISEGAPTAPRLARAPTSRAVADGALFCVALACTLCPRPEFYPYREALARLVLIQALFLCGRVIRGKGLSIIDVAALACLFIPSYALVYPLLYLNNPFALFGLGESAFRRAFDANAEVVLAFWLVALFADTDRSRERLAGRLRFGFARLAGRVAKCSPLLPAIAVLGLTAVYVRHLLEGGGLGLLNIRDRGLFLSLTGDLAWWKVKFAIVGLTLYLLLHVAGRLRAVGKSGRTLLLLVPVSVSLPYMVVSLAVGNRREPILVVFSAFLVAFVLGSTLLRRYVIPLVTSAVVAGMLYLGVWRNSPHRPSPETAALVVLGEFVFPYQATLVALEPGRPLLHGASYLQPLFLFVPRAVWPGKPLLLAERFIDEVGTRGVLGYGYTPLAEAVTNFGPAGPVILGIVFAAFLFYTRRHASRCSLLYLLVFAETVGFHRGELAAVACEIVLLALIIVVSVWITGRSHVTPLRVEDPHSYS